MTPLSKQTLCAVLPFAGLLWAAPVVTAYDEDYERYDRSGRYSDEDRYDREDRYGREQPTGSARMSERDLRSFEHYLDTHDETARTLYENPELINDRRFVRTHDALNDWLTKHPDAAEALHANPDQYLWRERRTSAADFLNQLLGSQR
jgi:hypothetical protein